MRNRPIDSNEFWRVTNIRKCPSQAKWPTFFRLRFFFVVFLCAFRVLNKNTPREGEGSTVQPARAPYLCVCVWNHVVGSPKATSLWDLFIGLFFLCGSLHTHNALSFQQAPEDTHYCHLCFHPQPHTTRKEILTLTIF